MQKNYLIVPLLLVLCVLGTASAGAGQIFGDVTPPARPERSW
jgi:hypothetical protein